MRLIDADALIAELEKVVQDLKDPAFWLAGLAAINEIKKAPTVQAFQTVQDVTITEPVRHGRWLTEYQTEDGRSMRCSQCRMVYWIGNGRDGNYCPNCGAKMTTEEEE